jgi:phenylacetate-coenzyme A ligase PaaK-like adenylate-forming protein
MNHQKSISEELRERLDATLEYSTSCVPFYQTRVKPSKKRGIELSDFPLIDRHTVDQHFGEFIVAERFPDYVITSGGTTGEPLAMTMRTEDEYEAVHEFLTGYRPRESPKLHEIAEFVLDLYLNTNGFFRRKAVGWPTVCVPIERRVHADLVRRLIAGGLDLGKHRIPVGRVQSQIGVLRTLTGYFAATDFRPAGHGVRSVTGYGGHISRVWLDRLKDIWGCPIEGRYGLSEFTVGNTTTCSNCGWLHYVTAWPEFLSLRNRTPVENGDAILALTSLVPFVVVQPRVRYLTGDLVTVGPICESTGLRGFNFRGRSSSSVWARVGEVDRVVFSEIDALEVLDQFEGVNRGKHTAEIQLWEGNSVPLPPFPIGAPRFRIDAKELCAPDCRINLAVELAFDPTNEDGQAQQLTCDIATAAQSELSSNSSDVAVAIRFVGPGGMK